MDERSLDNEHKPELLDYFCHEVRTSLNSITLLSKLLEKNEQGNLSDSQLEYAQAIYRSSHSLLELVNKLLDLSRIKSGEMELQFENINLQELCEKLEQMFLPLAREKNIYLTFEIARDNIETIQSDRLCIEHILKNLISNALKFTSEGGVSVFLDLLRSSEITDVNINAEKIIVFQVQDTGIGIPKEKQQIILEDFKQADESIQEKYGGTGLGLAICKKTIDALGGELKINSKAGAGSTFCIYLPVNKCKTTNSNLKKGKEINNRTTGFKKNENHSKNALEGTVLLVDDSPMHNSALKEFLSHKVKNCFSATSAKETYKILETNHVDCIILDMVLPDANGYEVLAYLNNRNSFKDIQTIVYTGRNLSKKEEQKIKMFADAVVYKNVGSYRVIMDIISSTQYESNQ